MGRNQEALFQTHSPHHVSGLLVSTNTKIQYQLPGFMILNLLKTMRNFFKILLLQSPFDYIDSRPMINMARNTAETALMINSMLRYCQSLSILAQP